MMKLDGYLRFGESRMVKIFLLFTWASHFSSAGDNKQFILAKI